VKASIDTKKDVLATTFARVERIYVPTNIVGPAYGTAVADRAMRVERVLYRLHLGLRDTAYDLTGEALPEHSRTENDDPHSARNRLRARVGEPELPHLAKGKWPPLSAAEHVALGLELNALHEALIKMLGELSGVFGKTHKVSQRARTVYEANFSLRCCLDSIVCREYPGDGDVVPGVPPTRVYIGVRSADRAIGSW
jgi:hypothetical protein